MKYKSTYWKLAAKKQTEQIKKEFVRYLCQYIINHSERSVYDVDEGATFAYLDTNDTELGILLLHRRFEVNCKDYTCKIFSVDGTEITDELELNDIVWMLDILDGYYMTDELYEKHCKDDETITKVYEEECITERIR